MLPRALILSLCFTSLAHATDSYTEAAEAAARNRQNIPPHIMEKAKEAKRLHDSPEAVEHRTLLVDQILKAQGIDHPNEKPSPTPSGDRLFVFVSSSVPLETLRRYASDLEKINGVMVLRGMIGGLKNAKPTIAFMQKVTQVDPACVGDCAVRDITITIDPIMFSKFGITQVPAVALSKDFDFGMYCDEDDPEKKQVFDSVVTYGDSSLAYHLQNAFEQSSDKRYLDLAYQLKGGKP